VLSAATTPPPGEEFPVDYVIEPAFLAVSLLMIMTYAIHFYFCRMRLSSSTVFGFGKRVRGLWVQKIMSEQKNYILGIQTLRNEIMVGTFIAKSSFLGITVIVAAAGAVDLPARLEEINRLDILVGKHSSPVPQSLKIVVLLLLQGGVFIAAVQYLRLIRHMSVQLGNCSGPGAQDEHEQDFLVRTVTSMYNRSAIFFFVAMRLMLLSFPAAGWIFGPTACLATSVLTVVFMYIMDRVSNSSDKLATRVEGLSTSPENAHAA